MFKLLFASLVLGLLGLSAGAQIKSSDLAPYYILNEWPGPYQDGYEVMEEIMLDMYQSPTNPINTGFCTLNKGRTFHPYSTQNENDVFVVVSGVKTFRAKNDLTDDMGQRHKKGDLILQLAELSEGICMNQVGDKIFEDSCPSMFDDWELILASPLKDHRMIKTKCDDGGTGWISESDLQAFDLGDAESSVRALTEEDLYNRGWMAY